MWSCPKCGEKHEDSLERCWNCRTDRPTVASVDSPPATTGPTIDDLVFVGLNGYALALDRKSGKIVWSNSEMRSGYVTLLLDGDRLIVSTNGYIYCLNPLNGSILWHNPLTGYGMGAPTSLTSVRGQSEAVFVQQAAANEQARSSSG